MSAVSNFRPSFRHTRIQNRQLFSLLISHESGIFMGRRDEKPVSFPCGVSPDCGWEDERRGHKFEFCHILEYSLYMKLFRIENPTIPYDETRVVETNLVWAWFSSQVEYLLNPTLLRDNMEILEDWETIPVQWCRIIILEVPDSEIAPYRYHTHRSSEWGDDTHTYLIPVDKRSKYLHALLPLDNIVNLSDISGTQEAIRLKIREVISH